MFSGSTMGATGSNQRPLACEAKVESGYVVQEAGGLIAGPGEDTA